MITVLSQLRSPRQPLRGVVAAAVAWFVLAGFSWAQSSPVSNRDLESTGPTTSVKTGTRALVFTNVTVIDVEQGHRLSGQTVVIAGHRIQALGPAAKVRIPSGARVVDARGKYLIPGLWDMHIHLLLAPETVGFPLLIANGVTGVRDAGTSVPLATLGRWKQEIAAGVRVGPRLYVAGPAVEQTCHTGAHQVCVTTPAEARTMVDLLYQAGADFIKTYVNSRELYLALAGEARRLHMPFGGHLPGEMDGLEASDSGAHFLDHDDYLSPDVCASRNPASTLAKCQAAAEHLRRNGTWVVNAPASAPTLPYQRDLYQRYIPRALLQSTHTDREKMVAELMNGMAPGQAETRPGSLAAWRAALRPSDTIPGPSLKAMLDPKLAEAAGLPLLAGTDAVLGHAMFFGLPGFTLQEHLVALALKGMSPLGVLQTATLNPAIAIGASDSLGSVAAGKLADLVLLDADPLADIANTAKIRAVVANGQYFDRAALDRVLADAEAAAHR